MRYSTAIPSDLPDKHSDILPSLVPDIDDPIPLPPPVITIAEPLLPPPPGHTWWHLDTGATGLCTNRLSNLLAPLPTNLYMGTAAVGTTSTIETLGSVTLSGTTLDGKAFHQAITQVYGVPSFTRCLFSLHSICSLGYKAIHSVGNYLLLIHTTSGEHYFFQAHPLHGNTDL